MFEREQLRGEFAELLQHGRDSAASIDKILHQAQDEELAARLNELKEHADRHVNMLERLLEIVD